MLAYSLGSYVHWRSQGAWVHVSPRGSWKLAFDSGFWGQSRQTPTGALPLDHLGDFRPQTTPFVPRRKFLGYVYLHVTLII